MYDDCYVLLDEEIKRDIRYCELIYPRDPKTKFYCTYCVKNEEDIQACLDKPESEKTTDITNVGADYCYFKYPWLSEYEQLFKCLEVEDCHFKSKTDEDLQNCLANPKGYPQRSAS